MAGRVPSLDANLEKIALHPNAARTATGQGTGYDKSDEHGKALVLIDSAAGTGTTPTLDISFEHAPDNATWAAVPATAVGTLVQITDAGASFQAAELDLDDLDAFVRVVYTIAGGTPSFQFSVAMVAAPREMPGGAAQTA